jgi:hypothetical protein
MPRTTGRLPTFGEGVLGVSLAQGGSVALLAAVLASVVDSVAPEAFRQGGPVVALASAAGFFTAFMLGH